MLAVCSLRLVTAVRDWRNNFITMWMCSCELPGQMVGTGQLEPVNSGVALSARQKLLVATAGPGSCTLPCLLGSLGLGFLSALPRNVELR